MWIFFSTYIKDHIFWEGLKNLWNLHQLIVLRTVSQILIGGDFAKFCGLLWIFKVVIRVNPHDISFYFKNKVSSDCLIQFGYLKQHIIFWKKALFQELQTWSCNEFKGQIISKGLFSVREFSQKKQMNGFIVVVKTNLFVHF